MVTLKVQNKHFWRKKDWKFPPGFELPIHVLRGELSTAELSDLLMSGHESSVYQVQNTLFTPLSQNDELWTISNKMPCKNSNSINISFHRCLFDKNMPRMLQQEGILSVLKTCFRRKMSWNVVTSGCYYWKSTKRIVSISRHILLCMSSCYSYEKSSISVQCLFEKHSGVTKGRYGKKTGSWTKFWFDSIFLNRSCKFIL